MNGKNSSKAQEKAKMSYSKFTINRSRRESQLMPLNSTRQKIVRTCLSRFGLTRADMTHYGPPLPIQPAYAQLPQYSNYGRLPSADHLVDIATLLKYVTLLIVMNYSLFSLCSNASTENASMCDNCEKLPATVWYELCNNYLFIS
jgi:hypothetical protein